MSFLVLLAGFGWNAWGAAPDFFFAASQADTEGLVFGRVAWSREHGPFSSGGLLGFVGIGPGVVTFDSVDLWLAHRYEGQHEAFLGETAVRSFSPYFSHNGLQGWACTAVDFLLRPIAAGRREQVFRTLTASGVALTGALLVLFVWNELGIAAALGALLVLASSPWLAALGRNLYWNLWVFLLPPLAIGGWLARRRPEEGWRFAAVAYGALLVRCLCGYEYMTAWAALAAAPVIYFAVRDAWPARLFAARIGLVALAGIAALCTSLALLTFQISAVTGSKRDAIRHLRLAVERRTSGEASELSPIYAAAVRARTDEVLEAYLRDPYDRQAARARSQPIRWLRSRSYGVLTLVILAASLWAILRSRDGLRRPLAFAVAIACVFAGVVAWLVAFKAHSFMHRHINPLMWHLFFLPLGAALLGWAIADSGRMAASRLFRRTSGLGSGTPAA